MNIAKELLQREEGDRISTVADLSKTYGVSHGTVQLALKHLQDSGCIKLSSRGHMGTYIQKLDYNSLLKMAEIKSIVGVMPLPYTKMYEGLATGIYTLSQEKELGFHMAYMSGVKNRLEMLKDLRCDFAVMSLLAARENIELGVPIEIVADFGPKSFVNEHILLFSKPGADEIRDGMVVGIDYSSTDHSILTHHLCDGKDVSFKGLMYSQILSQIINKKIDAAIWNMDAVKGLGISLNCKPIKYSGSALMNTNAVIVALSENIFLSSIIKRFIDVDYVLSIQKKVVSGEMDPSY